ncbi:hypothetical protein Vadar_014781 [Vaccinium darrowii]|uniref:Uncharacterized protein n=1 Tax=Vaccinium darrowii TaxID=229202 RepID=A0ACB7XA12_9ERIC|nr:hypothetical protein Vadar_014781 [Vaccinium darrowii]
MELLFLSFLLLVLILFLSVSFGLFLFPKQSDGERRKNLPPGKMGLPVVGETIEFVSSGRHGIPEKFVKYRMKKFSQNVFKTSLIGESIAVFCGSAGNKFLFSNENKLVATWFPRAVEMIFPSSLHTSSSLEALKMRKMAMGFLKPEALQNYVGIMDSIAKQHFETNWDSKKQVTVSPLAKEYTFAVACKIFLSIEDPKHIERFSQQFQCLLPAILSSPIPINFPGTPLNRAIKASKYIRNEILAIIKQRKSDLTVMEKKSMSRTKYDILSHMLFTTNEEGKFMSDIEIAEKLVGFLVGGFDSASTVITCMIKYLAELPHIYDQVLKEQKGVSAAKRNGEPLNWEDIQKMKYSWNVASEVLRLAPPTQGMFREAITEFTYAGFYIPKGWKIFWSTSSTHKNPDYFQEPEKFDPSRFEGDGPPPYSYVPFGGGPRMCPGKEYARLVILVFMYNMVGRYKWEKILPNEKIVFNPLPMPEKGLPIRLLPH